MSGGKIKASVRQARDRVVRALVRLGARRQLRQIREARQAALVERCRLARLRVLRQIGEAVGHLHATLDDDPIRLAARATHLRDKAEALWLLDEKLMSLEPIPCEEDPIWTDA